MEFALVVPLLATIVFGVLQFGLYFYDSLTANEAVRTSVRTAVVQKASASCTGSFDWSVVRCTTRRLVGHSDAAVRITAPSGWVRGAPLTVCVLFHSSGGGVGPLPLPHGGYVQAKLQMSVEETTRSLTGTGLSDAAPAGQDWSWC